MIDSNYKFNEKLMILKLHDSGIDLLKERFYKTHQDIKWCINQSKNT